VGSSYLAGPTQALSDCIGCLGHMYGRSSSCTLGTFGTGIDINIGSSAGRGKQFVLVVSDVAGHAERVDNFFLLKMATLK
jgi:hypothetical protein